ncbi:MFS domain-containing protein [Fusarium keratoplasticum]|uniref:MFS domain-containing protein n=1 Tax=Fusarium keratoplasticum TaxID=1328300 RepID=A0ACC0RGI1_9HYPO|nr:MFS domain-containing protein [Fusarium keratoplasticum]KAI8684715.1 MFS domain-containing protein [Fusarium keratoplasticum]
MINAEEWDWGLKTARLYVGLGAPFTVGMWFLIAETKGHVKLAFPSAELDELFERKTKPFRFHKTTIVTQRMVQMNGEERA